MSLKVTKSEFVEEYWPMCNEEIKRVVINVVEEHLVSGRPISYVVNKYYKDKDGYMFDFRAGMRFLAHNYKRHFIK